MHEFQMKTESLKLLEQLHTFVTVELEDTLDSVAQLEQQQDTLWRSFMRRDGLAELLKNEHAERNPAVTRLRKLISSAAEARDTGNPRAQMVLTPLEQPSASSASSPAPLCPSQGHATTLMVRPVPRGCSHEMLVAFWPPNCPDSPYDLLYAPHRKTRGASLNHKPRNGLQGYVFINFLTADGAERFRKAWQGRVPEESEALPGQVWQQPLEISDSHIQGFERNVRQFVAVELTRLDPKFWPVVLIGGQRQSFADVARNFQQQPSF
jgi:hypothetical protein